MYVLYDTALYLLECYSDRKQRGLRVQKADGLQNSWGPATDFANEMFIISIASFATVCIFSRAQAKF